MHIQCVRYSALRLYITVSSYRICISSYWISTSALLGSKCASVKGFRSPYFSFFNNAVNVKYKPWGTDTFLLRKYANEVTSVLVIFVIITKAMFQDTTIMWIVINWLTDQDLIIRPWWMHFWFYFAFTGFFKVVMELLANLTMKCKNTH